MITYAMMYTVAVSVPIALAAGLLAWALRRTRRPERFVWLAAIALLWAVPTFMLIGGPVEDRAASTLPPIVAPVVMDAGPFEERSAVGFPERVDVLPVPAVSLAESTVRIGPIVLLLWITASLLLSVRWAVTAQRLQRRLDAGVRDRLFGTEVWRTSDVGPGVAGVFRPRVVVPDWLSSLPEAQQRLIVRHEQEHVRAADPLLVAAARLARIVTPWNPVAWLLAGRLHRGVELDCDHRVLRTHPDVETYGSTLLMVSSLHSGAFAGTAAFADSEASLRQRILAMTARPGATSIVSIVGAVILGAVLLVGVFQVPVPAIRMNLDVEPTPSPVAVTAERSDTWSEELAAEVAALQTVIDDLSQEQRRSVERAEAAETELAALTDRLRAAEAAIESAERAVPPTQSGTITGVMVDGASGRALPRVQVFIPGTGLGGLTNDQGRFVLLGVPAGEHELVGERIGYAEVIQEVSVAAGEATMVNFELDQIAVPLDGVLVTEDPIVRRNTWDHARIYVDGVRVNDHEYGLDLLDQLQAKGGIERIEIIKGEAARERFGSGFSGGVILVTTKEPESEPERRPVRAPLGQPTFTPYTVPPALLNEEEVEEALQNAYPRELRDDGVGGTVHMYLYINDRGLVEDTRISQSSGYQALDDAALSTAVVQRFSPALNRDEAVAVWVSIPMTFLEGM